MEYLAHSERNGIPGQLYVNHIKQVKQYALRSANEAAYSEESGTVYAGKDAAALVHCTETSAEWHDLGKLLQKNQEVLLGNKKSTHLPINHADAGAAALKLVPGGVEEMAAMLVYSHHRGLPNCPEELIRGKNAFRERDHALKLEVDSELEQLIRLHTSLTDNCLPHGEKTEISGDFGMFVRMALSCLADGDHTDTALHYGNYPKEKEAPLLLAEERLTQLNNYISGFATGDERNRLRSELYHACREAVVGDSISACDSPVGSGKTTAVMAHLLAQAVRRKARRIFVVLPFTNIITQSVEIYRKALVLPGEDPTEVVAELHHRADFESEEARAFSAQWRAPIIVTTAVSFFETLASNRPAGLRRLHELPGSVIFVDEAHAALPVKLLPLTWRWMQILADEWSCYWVLASGSLVEFWNIEEIALKKRYVPKIVSDDLRDRLSCFESRRIQYRYIDKPISMTTLIDAVISAPGPRLLIVNTIQNAGVLAERMCHRYGGQDDLPLEKRKVIHLSTGLSAEDRRNTYHIVEERLKDKQDADWTLVATSCVETGVDFSFRTGFRELASLLSLLQAAGRVNRNGKETDAAIWSFSLQEDPMLTSNPGLSDSREVLRRFFERNTAIGPGLSTSAIINELNRGAELSKYLLSQEEKQNFVEVEAGFKVIEEDTVLAIADGVLKQRLRAGLSNWKDLQQKGIAIRRSLARKLQLPCLLEGIYDWNLGYDAFLGVAAGLIDVLHSKLGV